MDTAHLLATARDGLRAIGYREHLLRDRYLFADVASSGLHQIDLAAFAQEPTTIRNACLGIAIAKGTGPGSVKPYQSLGAPQILGIYPQTGRVVRWRMRGLGEPTPIGDDFPVERLHEVIIEHGSEWSPSEILRARSIVLDRAPRQLDFFDVGLIPSLEGIVQKKLDTLLKEVLAFSKSTYVARHGSEPEYQALFRLVFRLLAAKLLADREYPGAWGDPDAQAVLREVTRFYFAGTPPEPVLQDRRIQQAAWDRIRGAFHFQNLSVEALAYAYENTLVSEKARRTQGVHATPPEIAEYVVQQLPFEQLPEDERTVFEPFAGHAPFLIAALGRLRSLLAPTCSGPERHAYFVRMLSGMEIDPFAREVARNSLILADYPNPDSWRLEVADAFTSPALPGLLKQAQVVLCNPPFEDFPAGEREGHPGIRCVNKAAEALRRVLEHPPKMLGFVLPRVFIDRLDYQGTRDQIDALYDDVRLVGLPDTAFRFSGVETVVLLAHGWRGKRPRRSSALVAKEDYPGFALGGEPSWFTQWTATAVGSTVSRGLWRTPLQGVWEALGHRPRLGEFAEIHRGIEYNVPFEANVADLVSDLPRKGFAPGLANVTTNFEPYAITAFKYLNMSPDRMLYQAYKRPWHRLKVVINAARLSRRGWSLSGAVDDQGLVCYQRFHGCWPKADLPVEVIAALLNGPVANAFVREFRTARDNQKRLLEQIPVPTFTPAHTEQIVSLVRGYRESRALWLANPSQRDYHARDCTKAISRIDAEVLAAYRLPARVERQLLDSFAGFERPGPVDFDRYYPQGFLPAIPWSVFTSEAWQSSSAARTLARLPVLHDPAVSAMVETLTEEETADGD